MKLISDHGARRDPDPSLQGAINRFTERDIRITMDGNIWTVAGFVLGTGRDIRRVGQSTLGRTIRHTRRDAELMAVLSGQRSQRPLNSARRAHSRGRRRAGGRDKQQMRT